MHFFLSFFCTAISTNWASRLVMCHYWFCGKQKNNSNKITATLKIIPSKSVRDTHLKPREWDVERSAIDFRMKKRKVEWWNTEEKSFSFSPLWFRLSAFQSQRHPRTSAKLEKRGEGVRERNRTRAWKMFKKRTKCDGEPPIIQSSPPLILGPSSINSE